MQKMLPFDCLVLHCLFLDYEPVQLVSAHAFQAAVQTPVQWFNETLSVVF